MNIEELEKEAIGFEENYTVYEVSKRKDGTDCTKKVCKVTVKEAYLAGAEPREKRIAELENKIADIKANCDLAIEGRDVKIMELEEQIGKMKNCYNCAGYYTEQCSGCEDYSNWELRR